MKTTSTFFLLIILAFCSCLCQGCLSQTDKQNLYDPQNGVVQNSETAKKIAEAIWIPLYGKSVIDEKPYSTTLIGDSLWVVKGSLKKGYLGGTAYIEIRKSDCKVLKVFHGK
jgi:hypothetical protein